MSIFSRFATRRTPASLSDLATQYLNQALPDISGIFQPTTDTPVEETPVEETVSGITPQLLQSTGRGGDDFSVYNPDPNRVRTNYINPFPFNPDDNLGFSDYGYPEAPKEGLAGLFETYVKSSPLIQFANKGLTAFGNMLPINRRGILENELIGQGLMLDDIGRVVSTDYNTPEGIMAGYNAAKITDETFDKRRDTIADTLKDKYGMSEEEIAAAIAGNYTGPVQTPLINRLSLLNQAQNKFIDAQKAAEIIAERREEEKRKKDPIGAMAKTQNISRQEAQRQQQAIDRDSRATEARGKADLGSSYDEGTYCFDPNTLIQMADGSEKKIKEIQLGDNTKGGEVTGVFQFKASDEIHDYKGVTVAGSHYVKEDGKFIMVKDSPLSIKINKIPVVYSLDTTGRRIFIKDIEFADYNGDGVAKNFLTNAGVDLTGFDKEVLRQVENRLI